MQQEVTTHPTRLACTDQRLTPRQRAIVEHVALGHTNAQIGLALGLSPYSVRNQLVQVFAAVGASNRADLVRLAVRTVEQRDRSVHLPEALWQSTLREASADPVETGTRLAEGDGGLQLSMPALS